MMPPDSDLEKVYRETDYIVDDDPPLRLNVGEQNDGMRILMVSMGVESAAFVTAWNPGSQRLPMDENLDRQADLLEAIEKLRLNYFVGRGEHPGEGWSEDSYLILGISPEEALALAGQFGQNAFLWIPISGVPELRWTGE
ncbi:MAG: DUF3293 domain-containing protein [Gammaproteobacteria bacterium]|nr:DUF3293 domain-containing protein [Gammaproteobacteria bacterium]